MIKASDLGFYAGNSAEANSRALQQAADLGGEILVDGRGIADISQAIILSSCTTIRFQNGIYLRRRDMADGAGYVLVNRGAFSGETDHHIRVEGLRLQCCGVECRMNSRQTEHVVPGLRGELSFYHVRDLNIADLEILDLPSQDFAIHVCDFEDLCIENVHIEGKKDAIHLGCGRRFVIRHGLFRTFDDPIALNAHDYASSNPMLGWIEDGLIEDCRDLDDENTTGFFCRILAGSWLEWQPGMKVQHSDTVVSRGRVYRVYMKPDGREYTSLTRPVHASGTETLDDIDWVMTQEGSLTDCGCRRITFRDISLEKKRPVAFSFHFDKDRWSRSVYPGSRMPVQEDITFDHIRTGPQVPVFFQSRTPAKNIRIEHSELGTSRLEFFDIETAGTEYGTDTVHFHGSSFSGPEHCLLACTGQRNVLITDNGCLQEGPLTLRGKVEVGNSDLKLVKE